MHVVTDAIIPALMHQIPSELRSLACLGESSTRMGDIQESPRVSSLFYFVKNVWLYNFKTVRPNLTCDTFSESAKRAFRWMRKENGILLLIFFPTPNFDFNVLFRAFSLSLLYYGAKIICSNIIFEYFACIKTLINKIGYSYTAGGTHSKWIIKSSKKNRYNCIACSNGCDHTNTNPLDPIRTT